VLDALAPDGSFARYVDYIGLGMWDNLVVLYGTERLQTVRRDENFCKIHLMKTDEERDQALSMLAGGLTPAERSVRAANPRQHVYCPYYTLLGLHIGADPSQNVFVRGIGERIKLQLEMTPLNQWVEADTTFGSVNTGVAGAGASTLTGDVVRSANLYCEYQHLYDFQRARLAQEYSNFRRYVFNDIQNHGPNQSIAAAGTLLNGSTTFAVPLRELTQPVETLVILPRWANDLNRLVTQAGGSRGRNNWNFGWFNPGGVAVNFPIIQSVLVQSGTNNFALRQTDVENLYLYETSRKFQGSNSLRPAILPWTYSHDPSMENAVLGFLDFSQADAPQLVVQFSNVAALADIAAAAIDDIGVSSGLDISVVAFTVNQLNFNKKQIRRPYN
jgi:hypothetical protein